MRWIAFIIVFGQLGACTTTSDLAEDPENSARYNDDYVLVEFAAKLEEDYHKIHKVPTSSEPEP